MIDTDTIAQTRKDAPQENSEAAKPVNLNWAVGRYVPHVVLFSVVLGAVWLTRLNLLSLIPAKINLELNVSELATPLPTVTVSPNTLLAPIPIPDNTDPTRNDTANTLTRQAELHTDIPNRPRGDIQTYVIVSGDTLFGIADKYGLKPETLVWGNPILKDNPHSLRPDQELRIPPVDGVLRDVQSSDNLDVLAKFYDVTIDDIIYWPGNNLDPDDPKLTVGQLLMVPGGKREFVQLAIPQIVRSTRQALPLDAGAGACAGGYSGGAIGSGSFSWPVTTRYVVGNNYWAGHLGLDLAASMGQSIFAADSGVVVFAGWNNWGFGQLVVIDHGNGWQTLYAHNSYVTVACGQSVSRGQVVAAGGSTGNSSGPHLHFEMNYQGSRPNPFSYLPAP